MDDTSHAVLRDGDLLVEVLRGNPGVEAIKAVRAQIPAQANTAGGGLRFIIVIPASVSIPGADVRTEIVEFLRTGADSLRAVAAVIEGTGLRASAIRSVSTGASLAARSRIPMKVFKNVADAAAWMDTLEGTPFDVRGLPASVEACRAG